MYVKIKESALIRPAEVTPTHRLWLSTLDLIHVQNYRHTVYLYKSNDSSNFFETKVVKEALSKALVPFYPAAGRLSKDKNNRFEVNCNGEGVLFIEAETDSTTEELGDFMPSKELQQLVPRLSNDSRDDFSCPFFLLQVTKFACGSVCLGVAFHHVLGDGTAALNFINTWSTIARGLSLSNPPVLDRTILRCRVPPTPTFHHLECDPGPTMKNPTKNPKSQSFANLQITIDQIKTLKAKTITNLKENKTKYSTYQILTAHTWRCTCKARGFADDQETKLDIQVDGRSRLNPPISTEYFGNVIFTATTIASSGDLLSEPLIQTVERLHRAIKRMDDEEYLRSALDYLEEQDDVAAVMRGPQAQGCPNLSITSWMRLPFYKADFGWGAPLLMRTTKMQEGRGYLLQSPTNDGSFVLSICLEKDHMESFKKIFYDF